VKASATSARERREGSLPCPALGGAESNKKSKTYNKDVFPGGLPWGVSDHFFERRRPGGPPPKKASEGRGAGGGSRGALPGALP